MDRSIVGHSGIWTSTDRRGGRGKTGHRRDGLTRGVVRLRAAHVVVGVVTMAGSLCWAPFVATTQAAPLTAEEQRGKTLYFEGRVTDQGRRIMAKVGRSGASVPATVLPCVNCHGYDGRGRPERGVVPPVILWEELAKSYGHIHHDGRRHGPFDTRTFGRAVVSGVDPADNTLDATMPRYDLTPGDIADLAAYLKRLKSDFDPGLTKTTIRIGTILPEGRLARLGDAVASVLSGYFKETNAGGGVHGRAVEMVVVRTGAAREAIIDNARRLMESENVFAIVAPFAGQALKEVQALAESRRIPLLGPLGMTGAPAAASARYVFHLLPVSTLQAGPLLEFAARKRKSKRRVGLVYATGASPPDLLKPNQGQGSQKGWQVVSAVEFGGSAAQARAAIQAFGRQKVDAVLYLAGRGGLPLLVREAAAQNWSSDFLVPGGLSSGAFMKAARETKLPVSVAYPTLPPDMKPWALAALRRSGALDGSKQPHLAQILAYSAAHILTEGLKRAGRSLARERLVSALESLYDFETGLLRPVRYGPSRRVGIRGAYVVSIDAKSGRFQTNAVWIEYD